jgi:hypothetical protein
MLGCAAAKLLPPGDQHLAGGALHRYMLAALGAPGQMRLDGRSGLRFGLAVHVRREHGLKVTAVGH